MTANGNKLKVLEYGRGSKSIILVHGGPGLPGYMNGLGVHLRKHFHIVEYYQRRGNPSQVSSFPTVEDHVVDLRTLIKEYAPRRRPLILLGHSWGAGLVLQTAIDCNEPLNQIILVSSMPFDQVSWDAFYTNIDRRLTKEAKKKRQDFITKFRSPLPMGVKNQYYKEYMALVLPVYNHSLIEPISIADYDYSTCPDLFNQLEAKQFTKGFDRIGIPVTSFHGDYDPIPYRGVRKILKGVLRQFHFHLIKKAGHLPWLEEDSVKNVFLGKLTGVLNGSP